MIDLESALDEEVETVVAGAVRGAPTRMLSRKLSIIRSFEFMSSSTSFSNCVLLNDFVPDFPNSMLGLSLTEELVSRLSMVILKLNMLSRNPSITFSLSFKSLIFLDFLSKGCKSPGVTFATSLLLLTCFPLLSALKIKMR